ncbi:hypothetical protein N7445_010713 [Penicillium cf. griseofulvum]|nr:hypothetical protein N7445_010713 [Penicillium cf. griseofulvum]
MENISSNGQNTDATTAPYELDNGLRRSKKINQNAMPDVPGDVALSADPAFYQPMSSSQRGSPQPPTVSIGKAW